MRVLNASQMYSAETMQTKEGITFLELMENAGRACAEEIIKTFPEKIKVSVICGSGKNGGDGYVIARKLIEAGYDVSLVMAFGEPKAQDAIIMREKLHSLENVKEYNWGEDEYSKSIENADLIVDCVFGIGYKARENDLAEEIFALINKSNAKVVSIDIPSGSECDNKNLTAFYVKADITIAISCLKPVHVFKPASTACGIVKIVDIGLSEKIVEDTEGEKVKVLTQGEAKELFPKRDILGNKGTFGRALSICGSRNMQGAAVLAANGAVRVGAGLVTACFPECAYNAIAPKLTEPLMLPLPSNLQGTFSRGAIAALHENIKKNNVVLLGCGLGLNLETKDIVWDIVENCEKPIIIDADGINALSFNIDVLKRAKAPVLLTPHPGEFARLTGKSIDEIENNRENLVREFADEYNVTVLLKGANTVIAYPHSNECCINTTGNQGMAKGGSGDLLSGIILGLAAQGLSLYESAVLGAYIHGKAGDMARDEFSLHGMTASDCSDMLKKLLKDYE